MPLKVGVGNLFAPLTHRHRAMNTTHIPNSLSDLIGVAAEMRGAILIYDRNVVVFANDHARALHHQQDWSATVTFDGIFHTGIAMGRIRDPAILADPEGHLAYATMARAREANFQFRREYDGQPFDRYHTAAGCDWNAQIWVPVRRHVLGDGGDPSLDLLGHVKRNRVLATMSSMLESMGIAMAVVTAEGRLLESSSLMKRHLRVGGTFERDLGNTLACRDPESTARLRKAIATVATGQEGAALVPAPAGDGGQQLVAVMSAPTEGLAVVVAQDVAQPESLQELLVSAFGLSKKQAEVTVRVAGGETADQIAMACDRKIDTVRQQIATSKAKIAAGRQHDLARIVTRAAALFGGISPPNSSKGKK